MRSPIPPNETERLAALREYNILDTPPEEAYDDITTIAAHICDAPIALISLVDKDRQWFKSKIGMTAQETSRDISFCSHAIENPNDVMVVHDALADDRFATNPLVTSEPHIRFYAGAPLVMRDGSALGTLCVIDRVPRVMTPEQLAALRALRRSVVAELELRHYATNLQEIKQRTMELEARERVKDVLESISDAFVSLDANWRYTYMNKKAGEIFNRKPEEMIGKHIWTEFPEGVGQPFHRAYEQAMAEQKFIQLEEYYPPYDRWFENKIYPSKDGLTIFFHETTERRRAEEKLRLSEQRFSNAFRISPAGITITRIADGKFVDVNESFLRMFEFNREEVIGHTSTELKILSPEERSKLIQQQIESGGLRDTELLAQSKSGKRIHLLFSSKQMELEGELHHVTTMIDITERKQAEVTLRETQRQLTSLIANLPGVVYRCRNDANWATEFVSEGALQLFGYPAADFMEHRREIGQLIHPDDQGRVWEEIQAALRERRRYELTYRIITASGDEKWLWEQGGGVFVANGTLQALEGFVTDITERKRSELALHEKEHLLSESQRIAHVGSWSWNLTGPVQWTDELYRVYGVSPETFTPTIESFFNLVYPEDRPAMQEWLRACSAGESTTDFEFRAVRPDGTVRFISGRGELVRDAEGRPIQMVGSAHDITTRKQAEVALRDAHDRLANIVATAPGIVCSFRLRPNGSSCYPYGGEHLEEVYGIPPGRLAEDAAPFIAMAHPDDLGGLMESVAESARNLKPFRHEWRVRHPAHGELWIETHSMPLREPDGSTLWHGVATDITARKQAEEMLRAQHEELENLYATTPVGLALIDRNLRFLRINEQLAAINGKPVEAHLGRTIEEALPELAPVLVPIYRRVLDKGEPVLNVEIHGVTPAAPSVLRDWLASYYPVRDAHGSVSGVSITVLEITERKQAEEEIRNSRDQLRQLSSRLQSIQEEESKRIAREVHDELGQAMTGLKMDIQWINKKLPRTEKLLSEKIVGMSKLIDQTIQTIRRIATELRPGVLDDLGLVAAIEWQAEEFQNRSGIRCSLSLPEEDVSFDPVISTAMFRIFQETLTNIVRHASATHVQVTLKSDKSKLVLEVKDNGIGISPERSSSQYSLGLLGMRERASMLGGEVTFSGKPSRGTTVTLVMPLQKSTTSYGVS